MDITKALQLRKKYIQRQFAHLNDMQQQAVFTINGPLLILAGAGSGKTSVLINRISNMVRFADSFNSPYFPDDVREDTLQRLEAAVSGGTKLDFDQEREISTGENMANSMAEYESLENLKILCVVGNLAGSALCDILEKNNAIVDAVEVYKTEIVSVDRNCKVAEDFRAEGADAVVFSSPSAVEGFAKNAANLALSSSAVCPKIVTIGEKTSEAVKKFGMPVARQASNPSPEAVSEAVLSVLYGEDS